MTLASPARVWSGQWGANLPAPAEVEVDVLIPSAGRPAGLAVTLAGLAAQENPSFQVIVSDQSENASAQREAAVLSMQRVLNAEGRRTSILRHHPPRGLAEQRQFLLDQASAPYVLYLDDDVWLEPGALERMLRAIRELGCGFVGSAVQGLSYLDDVRPPETAMFELWHDSVQPERVRSGSEPFERWPLHNAANLTHVAADLELERGQWLAYRVAWVGGCTLYDRAALLACGGFDFWRSLPPQHAGEDVAAQWRVMERYGGAGIVPSGAVHLEAETTVPDRRVNATDVVFGAEPAEPEVRRKEEEQ